MKESQKLFIAILCGTMMALVFSGCNTTPPMSPLQKAATEIVLKDPANPERWVEYGRACLLSDNPYGAELAFKKAIQLNEKYIPAYKHLGLVLVTLQRQSEAEEVHKQALKISDSDSELWTAYGYCLIDLDKDKQALEAFQWSISLNTNPTSVISARLGASALLRRQGDEVGAQREYEQAVSINPDIVRIVDEQKALGDTEIVDQSQEAVSHHR
jgi:tetratricopeptide (TPR) repeat protein